MEFPGLGKHCSLFSCKRLDFLPMNCDACEMTFCNDHVSYESHSCQSAYKKDVQVPVCPLCNKPIPIKRGEPPDIKVGEHIDRDCESDPAKEQRKANTNKCSAKGCKKKELVPVICDSCRKNFCLRHRHPQDHECLRIRAGNPTSTSVFKTTAATKKLESRGKPQQTSLSVLGRDLDRARRERANPSNTSRPPQASSQQALSEDEALTLAIQASLSETTPESNSPSSTKPLSEQEEEDRALAQAIAESEREARTRQRQQQQQQTARRQDDGKSCAMS